MNEKELHLTIITFERGKSEGIWWSVLSRHGGTKFCAAGVNSTVAKREFGLNYLKNTIGRRECMF